MDSIIVKVADLAELVNMLTEDKMTYAELSLLDADEGEKIPASLEVTGISPMRPVAIAYGGIDAAEGIQCPNAITNIR